MTVNQLCLMYNYVNKNDIFEKLEEEELEFNNRKGYLILIKEVALLKIMKNLMEK